MSYITDKIRSEVALRAKYCCEYCLIYEEDMFLAFEVDHIIAKKHGGGNEIENLAFCCPHCNQHKGSDIATFLVDYEDIIPLFNPRKQKWSEHFSSSHGEIIALSKIG